MPPLLPARSGGTRPHCAAWRVTARPRGARAGAPRRARCRHWGGETGANIDLRAGRSERDLAPSALGGGGIFIERPDGRPRTAADDGEGGRIVMMRLDEVRLDPGWDHAASSSSSSGSERRRAAMPASTSFKVGADAVAGVRPSAVSVRVKEFDQARYVLASYSVNEPLMIRVSSAAILSWSMAQRSTKAHCGADRRSSPPR